MSGTNTGTDGAAGGGSGQEFDAPTRARLMGWRPREEWKRDPSQWKTAEEFLEGIELPAVLANRYKTLETRSINTERELHAVRTQLGESVAALRDLTEMNRTSEQRAYQRAVRELQKRQDEAAAAGDTTAYNAAKVELEEVRKTEPKAPAAAARTEQPPGGGAARAGQPNLEPAEVTAWKRDNPWYLTDPDMQSFADGVHFNVLRSQPNLTMAENLAKVREMAVRAYPEKFGGARAPANGGGDGGNNSRREEPSHVTPSGGDGGGRRRTLKRTFDAIPQDSKAAYERYARQLEGKGKPLTKEEWAENYWGQFEEVE